MNSVVVVAHRRKGSDMWDDYYYIEAKDKRAELQRWRERGQIAKAFPNMQAFREDVFRKAEKG